jgi:hypothetical protein
MAVSKKKIKDESHWNSSLKYGKCYTEELKVFWKQHQGNWRSLMQTETWRQSGDYPVAERKWERE